VYITAARVGATTIRELKGRFTGISGSHFEIRALANQNGADRPNTRVKKRQGNSRFEIRFADCSSMISSP
jgi:hypothetical protein